MAFAISSTYMRISLLLVFGSTLVWPPVSAAQDAARDKLVVETLVRLKRFDVSANEKLRGSVLRHLATIKESPKYVEYTELFAITENIPELIKLARSNPTDTLGVDAITATIRLQGSKILIKHINDGTADAIPLLQALGQSTEAAATELLITFYKTKPPSRQILTATALAISKTIAGQRFLLHQAEVRALPKQITFAVGNALYESPVEEIRNRAKQAITLPATADAKPLPPLVELVSMTGTAVRGQELFFKKGTCSKCHQVDGKGKEVGPNLTEIGSKLSKQAMFTSILDPSAGVSHNYETYSVITLGGNVVTGLKISETKLAVIIRTADGIDKTVPQKDIDELIKTDVSLMPADLQRLLSVPELVDLVAYLRTLTKK